MNLSPEAARQLLIRNSHTLRHGNGNLSRAGAIRMACQIAPGVARAAGLKTTGQIADFANSASDSGSPATPGGAEIANSQPGGFRQKIAARDRLVAKAQAYQQKYKVTYDVAWRRTLSDPQFANDVAAMNSPISIPAMTSGATMQANMDGSVAALMGIRGDLDDEEIRTVFRAVGKNLTPADYANIWSNLKNYWAGKDTGLSPQDTEIFLRSRFPALTAKLVSLNILQANNTPDSPAASAFARTLKKLNS